MKALLIADVMGKPGRKLLEDFLPQLIEQMQIDFVVANAENAAHGHYPQSQRWFGETASDVDQTPSLAA